MTIEIGFKGMCLRRQQDGDGRTVEGIAVPFGDVIRLWNGTSETFDRDCEFQGLEDAKLYYQHDALIGSIVRGENRDDGLWVQARIADTQLGRDAVALLEEGAIDSLSVGFVPIDDHKDDDGVTHRRKVRLLETSLVSWPAYQNAKVKAHRNQERTNTMTDTTKIEDLLDKLGARQDEQAELMRKMELSISEQRRLATREDELTRYRSMGDLIKHLYSKDDSVAEQARADYQTLIARDYTGMTSENAHNQPQWVKDRIRILETKRKVTNLISRETLPADGMSISYLTLKTDTMKVSKQAEEGDVLAYGEVSLAEASATIDTYGGYARFSRQQIERANTPIVDTAHKALVNAYAANTEQATRDAVYGAIKTVEDADKLTTSKTVATLTPNDWIDLIIDASEEMDARNANIDFLGVSKDVFKAIAKLSDNGDRFMNLSGAGSTTLGDINLTGITGNLLGVSVHELPNAEAGTVGFLDREAVTMWESGSSPFQLQDDNVINLSREISIYGYAAYGTTFAKGILPVKLGSA